MHAGETAVVNPVAATVHLAAGRTGIADVLDVAELCIENYYIAGDSWPQSTLIKPPTPRRPLPILLPSGRS